MSDYSTKNIIDYAMDGDAIKFREQLYGAIHDRVSSHIEAKKQEVARNLIGQQEQIQYEEVDEIDEATGNTEQKHIDSIIKMKEVKKSKHDMAPSIHDHMEDALEKGDHKKINDLHKVFKHITKKV